MIHCVSLVCFFIFLLNRVTRDILVYEKGLKTCCHVSQAHIIIYLSPYFEKDGMTPLLYIKHKFGRVTDHCGPHNGCISIVNSSIYWFIVISLPIENHHATKCFT